MVNWSYFVTFIKNMPTNQALDAYLTYLSFTGAFVSFVRFYHQKLDSAVEKPDRVEWIADLQATKLQWGICIPGHDNDDLFKLYESLTVTMPREDLFRYYHMDP